MHRLSRIVIKFFSERFEAGVKKRSRLPSYGFHDDDVNGIEFTPEIDSFYSSEKLINLLLCLKLQDSPRYTILHKFTGIAT